MKHPEVKSLYKYREFNNKNLEMLVNNEVWYSLPNSFNDPFDCSLQPYFPKREQDRKYQVSQIIDRLYDTDKAEKLKNELLHSGSEDDNKIIEDEGLDNHFTEVSDIGIYSLSKNPKQLLMWSHYAKDHTGFCIQYARNDKPNNILSHIMCRPVNYSFDYPNLNRELNATDINIYTKSEDWGYEDEWRIVSKKGGRLEPMFAPITGVIFGLKMSQENRETIMNEMNKNIHISFYECKRIPNKFALDIVEIKR